MMGLRDDTTSPTSSLDDIRADGGDSLHDDEDDLSSNVTRSRRAAEPRLGAASSLRSLPVNSISSMAENVSLAYQPDVWTNDMIFKVRQTAIHTAM